jgi:hypothetical protein
VRRANEEYEHLAKDVLFWVMRHAFNSGDPKGIFCCPTCTLSLSPAVRGLLLSMGELRRTKIQCPQGPERRYIGLWTGVS